MDATPADRTPDLVPDLPGDVERPLGDGRPLDQILSAQRLESLGRLATGIAHDFNNVLGVILGYVELAKMAGPGGKGERHLAQALQTIDRARMLADRLMEFARGGVKQSDESDLNEAVTSVHALLGETTDRRVRWQRRLANDVPWIAVEPERLQQVVMNLCVNAIDAMGGAAGELVVETQRVEVGPGDPAGPAPGAYARLRVRDTGPGIPPSGRNWIFQPYASTREGGTGMGLWATRRIVEQAGGRIDVSDGGPGAIFTVTLPAAPRRADAPAAAPAAQAATGRVLVIDDEPGVREVIRSYLEDAGHAVCEAASGQAGLAALGAGDPVDLVLLDLHLDDVPGRRLAERIRGLTEPPRIVFITGDPTSPDLAGAPFVGKPFLREDLLRAVDTALRA